jgi:hypothetical protein
MNGKYYVVLHSLGGLPYSCYVYGTEKEAAEMYDFIADNLDEEITETSTDIQVTVRYLAYGDGNELRLIESDN